MSDQRTFRLQPNVHADLVGDEAVAISFITGHYYSIRGTGALIIGALSKGLVSEEEVVEALTMDHTGVVSQLIQAETTEFFDTLVKEGIAERYVTQGPFVPLPESEMPYGYQPPEAHKELADIVTLDPIHEVSDAGWPERR